MKRGIFRSESYIKLVLYLAVVILINLVSLSLFFRVDLTRDNLYSLSPKSKEVVSSLVEPMTIKAFFSPDLPPPYNNIERYLRDLLKEYSLYANQNLNYSFYHVGPNSPENKKMAQDFGIQPLQVQVVQEDEMKYKNGYMGLVMLHGDAIEKLPSITSTRRLEYQLTTAIENMKNKVSALLSLEDKVEIRLYLSSELEKIAPYLGIDKLPELPDKIKEVVNQLNEKNYNKLNYTSSDPGQDLKSIPEEYNLQKLKWPDIQEADISAGQGVIGLIMKYKDRSRSLNLMNVMRLPLLGTQYQLVDLNQVKEIINNNLKTLLGINQDLGYLTDHGTPSINPYAQRSSQNQRSIRAFQQLISDSYTLKEISLEEGIPEGVNSLVIAGPQEEFSDYELYQIDQALMRGTNLAIFLDRFKLEEPKKNQQRMRRSGQYVLNQTGLSKLLNHYGLSLEESIVLDENCYKQKIPASRGGGQQPIYYAPIIKNTNINHQLSFMKSIKGLVTFKASPVYFDSTKKNLNQVKAYQLFSSSKSSWTMNNTIKLNPMYIHPPKKKEDKSSRPLAYYLQGKFPSYFADKSIPEKEQASQKKEDQKKEDHQEIKQAVQAPGQKLSQGQPAQLLVVGTSQMVYDTLLNPQVQSPNSLFVLNALDQLNNRSAMAQLRSKVQEFNPLRETSPQTKTFIKAFNIVGLPVLVILFGLLVWFSRNQRKKKIQQMFS